MTIRRINFDEESMWISIEIVQKYKINTKYQKIYKFKVEIFLSNSIKTKLLFIESYCKEIMTFPEKNLVGTICVIRLKYVFDSCKYRLNRSIFFERS